MKRIRYESLRTLIIVLISLVPMLHSAYAQKEWNVWYFGNYAGIDFNGGAPVALADGAMHQWEGCASIADSRTGRLLFYTDGDTVWNARHVPMTNGTGLLGHISSTQSAAIIPMPGDSNRYYIFTASAGEYDDGAHPNLGIHYSVVDMTLDGGLGEIVRKNVRIAEGTTEKMVAVRHANGRDYWIVVHGWWNNTFKSFRVSRSGVHVSDPVESAVGAAHLGSEFGRIGAMKVSPNGRKLALAGYEMNLVQLFDFNNITGVVSSPLQLPSEVWEYGVCFSPDNTKLYITTASDRRSNIYQFDLSAPSAIAIIASRTLVGTFPNKLGDLQLGPDGKIYVACGNSNWLGVINKPNVKGSACDYVERGLFLDIEKGRERYSVWGLPNVMSSDLTAIDSSVVPPQAIFEPNRTAICAGEAVDFHDASLVRPTRWEWSFPGGTPSASADRNPSGIRYNMAGTYVATLVASSVNGDDTARMTITVNPLPTATINGGATESLDICVGGSAVLRGEGGVNYTWSPSTGLSCTDCESPIATPSRTTTYTLTATNSFGCVGSDQVTVTVNEPPKADAGADVTICPGGIASLRASGGVSYRWKAMSGLDCYDCAEPKANPTTTTTYRVIVTNAAGCSDSDEVVVTVRAASVTDAGPDVTICPTGSTVLAAADAQSYSWSPAYGLSCTDCRNPVATPSETTVYTVRVITRDGCPAVDSVTVNVRPVPKVDAGPPIELCVGEKAVLNASGGVRYLWSPAEGLSCVDCPTPTASPDRTTLYTVTVFDANGCAGEDTVTVTVNPAPREVKAHISRSYGVYPGTRLDVPVILDEPLDLARVDELVFSLRYDPGMLRLLNGTSADSVGSLTRVTLLGGWTSTVLDSSNGSYRVRLKAPPGKFMEGAGKLLLLSFRSFLGGSITSELPFTIDLVSAGCTRVITSPGLARIDSVCGLNQRLIVGGLAEYSLAQNNPNPFNPTTQLAFSLGLDGWTILTIHDAQGREVAKLVDQYLQPGEYSITWDASGHPSGLYYYRVSSGVWSKTGRMILRK